MTNNEKIMLFLCEMRLKRISQKIKIDDNDNNDLLELREIISINPFLEKIENKVDDCINKFSKNKTNKMKLK